MFNSIRWRLMVWNVAVFALLLTALTAFLYFGVRRTFYHHEYELLTDENTAAVEALQQTAARTGSRGPAIDAALRYVELPRHTIVLRDGPHPVRVRGGDDPLILPNLDALALNDLRIATYITTNSGKRHVDQRLTAVRRIQLMPGGETYLVVVSRSLIQLQLELREFRRLLALLFPAALLLAGAAAWFLVEKALAPVVVMSATAREIEAGNLDQRLPVANAKDELGGLASTFNDLLARLHRSFSLQRQFMADASHELRTPLSVVRTAASVMLSQESRTAAEYRDALAIVEAQSGRMTSLVDQMFRLARADAGALTLHRSDFYLDELIQETVRDVGLLATPKRIRLETELVDDCLYNGDTELLQRMLLNLLENAVKYTPSDGQVRVQLQQAETLCTVRVIDNGRGIRPENQQRIFQRFFRESQGHDAEHAVARGADAGLGLAIALTIAECHGGSLRLERSGPEGSSFVAQLPRVAA